MEDSRGLTLAAGLGCFAEKSRESEMRVGFTGVALGNDDVPCVEQILKFTVVGPENDLVL